MQASTHYKHPLKAQNTASKNNQPQKGRAIFARPFFCFLSPFFRNPWLEEVNKVERCKQHQLWFRGTYSYLSACFVSHPFPAPMVRRSKKSRALRKKPRILIGIFLLGLVSTALMVSRSDKVERCEQHRVWFRGTLRIL